MFVFVIAILMAGFPVAFGLAGGALLFAAVGYAAGCLTRLFWARYRRAYTEL